jgi:uncharacterized protein YbjT (DUF2867 family)
MRVAILGGTGFVGSYLIDSLLDADHSVSVLVRPGSDNKLLRRDEVAITSGDLSASGAIDDTCRDCDALIYNVGILREFPGQGITFKETQLLGVERAIEAAQKAGLKRFLLMSANGVREDGTSYQATKYRAEELLRNSGLEFTIFSPSVIFGDPRGQMEFATQLYGDMVAPALPAVGFFTGLNPAAGRIMMSPVHVADVASAFVKTLEDSRFVGQTIHIGGPEALSWPEMIRRIAAAAGKSKMIIPMPIGAMKLAASLLDRIPQFPVTRDQLTMLAESNVAESDELARIIDREPRSFSSENLSYLAA